MKYIKKYSNVNDAVNDNGILSPFICSIDMEGSEFPAMLGMKTEEPYQPLIIEVNPETGKPEILPAPSNSIITYEWSSQLQLNTNSFDVPIKSHQYDSTSHTGIIEFDGILTSIGVNRTNIASNLHASGNFTIYIPKTVVSWPNDSGLYDIRENVSGWIYVKVEQTDGSYIQYSAYGTGGMDYIYFNLSNGTSVSIRLGTCIAKDTPITLADRSTKLIQDITYNDDLLVWDFDNGKYGIAKPLWIKKSETCIKYWLCKFSNGTELKLIGSKGKSHRVFNYTDQVFEYPQDCIGKEIYTEHGLTTLLSCEQVEEPIEFYNIITEYHMNLFANHILTSCRYNNVYPIENMKFIKEERPAITLDEYDVPEKYYYGMRLGEQVIPVDETQKYIQNLINLSL